MDIGAQGMLKDFEKCLRMPEATPTGKQLTTKIRLSVFISGNEQWFPRI
jgi:hypothetical protein